MTKYDALLPKPVKPRQRPKLAFLADAMGGIDAVIETIIDWHDKGNTWTDIALQFEKDHGIRVSREQVRQWYLAATREGQE